MTEAFCRPKGIPIRPCPVCGAKEHRIVYRKWGYPIRRCSSCGLGSTKVDDGFDPAGLYDRGYFQGAKRDGYADYFASEPVLRSEFRRALARLRRYAPTGRLLEIGCAYGFFLMEAGRYFRCTGVDVSKDAIDFARTRGLDVHCAHVDDAFLRATGPFDAVVMLDVIEHLEDPVSVLKNAHRAIPRGGCIMITTGDWGSLYARLAGRYWRLMTPPQHLFFFSKHNLVSLLNRIGFEVVDCGKPWKTVPLGPAIPGVGVVLERG